MINQKDCEKLIKKTHYWNNGKTTICILTLDSGFEIVGTSSILDKSEFDIEIGKKYAKKEAVEKIIEYEAYKKQPLVNRELDDAFRFREDQNYIRSLLKKGKHFFELEENEIEGITKVVFDQRDLNEEQYNKLSLIPSNNCYIEFQTRF